MDTTQKICYALLGLGFIFFIAQALYLFIKWRQSKGTFNEDRKIYLLTFTLSLICIILYLIIFSSVVEGINKELAEEKESQEFNEEIRKLCYNLDKTVVSDLKATYLQNEDMYGFSELAENYNKQIEDLKYNYYYDYRTLENFSNFNTNIYIYSVLYKNLEEIKKELNKRKGYCLKNECKEEYYNRISYYNITRDIQKFYKLNCDKTDLKGWQ